MMSCKVLLTLAVLFLAMLAMSEGMSLAVEQHCRCIENESKPMAKRIKKVEMIPANSHCERTEIIATLKNDNLEVCLDPEAPWVKRIIAKILSKRRPSN